MFSHRALAAHVLRALAAAQRRGRPLTLASLTERIGARKADVREIVTRLHQEGHLDATTLRLSLSGFAVGTALASRELPALRRPAAAAVRAA